MTVTYPLINCKSDVEEKLVQLKRLEPIRMFKTKTKNTCNTVKTKIESAEEMLNTTLQNIQELGKVYPTLILIRKENQTESRCSK